MPFGRGYLDRALLLNNVRMNKVFEERDAFSFYRSYYETSLLLPDKDRLEFIDCILIAEFTGEIVEPKSKLAKLAFKGQIHSISKQIKGFEKGKKTYPNGNPTKGAYKGDHKGSHKEDKEQEKEKEKEKVKSNKLDIDSRKTNFAHTLTPYIEQYGKEMIRDFYEYWTETNDNGKKFKREMQKTWNLERRLRTWNSNNFNSNKNGKSKTNGATSEEIATTLNFIHENWDNIGG